MMMHPCLGGTSVWYSIPCHHHPQAVTAIALFVTDTYL